MKKCSNARVGALLHGYELQILTPHETEEFELHLLECEICREEVAAFSASADFIRMSSESRKFVDIVLKKQVRGDSRISRILSQLWPKNISPILRPAVLLLLLISIVGVNFFRQTTRVAGKPGIYQVDNLSSLSTTRSAEAGQTLKSSERNVLTLIFKDTWSDSTYALKVVSRESAQIFYENANTRFNSSEATILLIEPNSLPIGAYEIVLFDSAGKSRWGNQYFQYE